MVHLVVVERNVVTVVEGSLAHNSGFSSELAVVKNIISNVNEYEYHDRDLKWEVRDFNELVNVLDIRDCTKSQYFAQKYGCKKHVVKSKTK